MHLPLPAVKCLAGRFCLKHHDHRVWAFCFVSNFRKTSWSVLFSNLTVDELGNAPDNFVSLYVVLPQEEKQRSKQNKTKAQTYSVGIIFRYCPLASVDFLDHGAHAAPLQDGPKLVGQEKKDPLKNNDS